MLNDATMKGEKRSNGISYVGSIEFIYIYLYYYYLSLAVLSVFCLNHTPTLLPIFPLSTGLNVCAYSSVSWHFLSMSSTPELFSIHFNGQVLTQDGHRVSSVGIISGTTTSASMTAVHTGRWLVSSHISKHLEGKLAKRTVQSWCRLVMPLYRFCVVLVLISCADRNLI